MAYLDESGVTSLTSDIKALADADYAPYAQGIEYIVGTQTAATNAWTGVTVDSTLRTGKVIAYYLPYAGNSSAATLNLTLAGGTTTGAKALRRTASSSVTTQFAAGNVIIMVYDGTYWKVSAYYDNNTYPTGHCMTAAATAAKSATCTYGYRDDANYFPCLFRYANTAANATLSIANYATTELPIYVNGARTSSSNTFGAGVIMFLYYNNAYYCYNDGRFPILYNGSVTSVQDLMSDLEVNNIEVAEQANVGETLVVGATGNQIADTVIARGGSISIGTVTNNATPSVSLDDSNNAVSFIINGSNRGIYDVTNSKWIVYSGSDNVTVANGLAASASGTSTSTNNFWTFINASTGMGVRFVLNPNTLNFVVMYTTDGGSSWSSTKTVASWS